MYHAWGRRDGYAIFSFENLKGRDSMENHYVLGKLILKLISKEMFLD
jgi:hypothetical protein